jgi:NADPH-dependent ferric siderophore reductase
MTETASAPSAAARARRRARAHTPMGHYDVRVTAVRRLTPHMARVTFAAPGLTGFVDDGPDQRLKLFLPAPGADRRRTPDVAHTGDWYPRWRAADPATRPVMRTYTVRASRPGSGELDVDFVLHGDTGPASAWAGRVEVGDAAVLFGAYAEHDPHPDADWRLIIGDETALPAIGAILADLPGGTSARVFVEVADDGERQALTDSPDVDVTWAPRAGAPAGETSVLLGAVRGADLPEGSPYAWVAGEASAVRDIRRHLVRDRAIPKESVTFMGYWRRGGPIEES